MVAHNRTNSSEATRNDDRAGIEPKAAIAPLGSIGLPDLLFYRDLAIVQHDVAGHEPDGQERQAEHRVNHFGGDHRTDCQSHEGESRTGPGDEQGMSPCWVAPGVRR